MPPSFALHLPLHKAALSSSKEVSEDSSVKLFYILAVLCTVYYLVKLLLPFLAMAYESFQPFVDPYPAVLPTRSADRFLAVVMISLFFILVLSVFTDACKSVLEKIESVSLFSFHGNTGFRVYTMAACILLASCALSNLFPTSSLPYWNEDNGAFIARYINLHESLPCLTYYDPFWNAGYKAVESLRSGVLGIYLLFYPLLLPEHIDAAYKFIVPLLILAFPFLIYASASLFGLNRYQSLCTSLFSFAAIHTGFWFSPVKCLKAGMYPYFLTSVLFVVCLGLIYKLLTEEKKGIYILFFIIAVVFALPHLTFVFMMAGPVAWLVFLGINRLKASSIHKKAFSLIVISSAGLILVLLSAAALMKPGIFAMGLELFTQSAETYERFKVIAKADLYETILQIWQWMSPRLAVNAVIFLFGGYQTVVWIKIKDRRGSLFLFSAVWLLILGVFGSFFLRGSQPVRYLTPAALVMLIPFGYSWCAIGEKISDINGIRKRKIITACMVFIFVNMTVTLTGAFSFVHPSPPRVLRLQNWIVENGSRQERFFLDLDGHKGIGGMPGRLQQLTGMHFMGEKAFDPDHRASLTKRLGRILNPEYFKTYNIRYLFLTTPEARAYAQDVLGFQTVKKFGPVHIYDTGINSSFFIKGNGRIVVNLNEIHVQIDPPYTDAVIIRFNYSEGIDTSEGVEIFKSPNGFGKHFIGIYPNGRSNISLHW